MSYTCRSQRCVDKPASGLGFPAWCHWCHSISVLGLVEPLAPQLPQPGHLHPAGATLPHAAGGKAFLMDIYGVTSLLEAFCGGGAASFVLWHKSICSWAVQSDDDRAMCHQALSFQPSMSSPDSLGSSVFFCDDFHQRWKAAIRWIQCKNNPLERYQHTTYWEKHLPEKEPFKHSLV